MENSLNSNDKRFPLAISNIINDSTFWLDLKELDELLLPFCAALNKLQKESARLYDIMHAYAWMLITIQKKSDSPFRSHMLMRLEKRWNQWEQPLLILSWLLHPSYGLEKLNIQLPGLSAPNLAKWLVYYYTNWFGTKPTNILLNLEDYLSKNSPFNLVSFDQFNGDILKY